MLFGIIYFSLNKFTCFRAITFCYKGQNVLVCIKIPVQYFLLFEIPLHIVILGLMGKRIVGDRTINWNIWQSSCKFWFHWILMSVKLWWSNLWYNKLHLKNSLRSLEKGNCKSVIYENYFFLLAVLTCAEGFGAGMKGERRGSFLQSFTI